MKKNQSVPPESIHKSDTVEIMVKSRVEDKSNNKSNTLVNSVNATADNKDSWENRCENNVTHIHCCKEREEEVTSQNGSRT